MSEVLPSITVNIVTRPFGGEWTERNKTVLSAVARQAASNVKVRLVCWPHEQETIEFARRNGYECYVGSYFESWLFDKPLCSFGTMFSSLLEECDTDLFVYINGDIILGPGLLEWLQRNAQRNTLYSIPRHNWDFEGYFDSDEEYVKAKAKARPEAWTALDLFAFYTADGREVFDPVPPFVLPASGSDSWLVARAGEVGWDRRLINSVDNSILHIEHQPINLAKAGAKSSSQRVVPFNMGIYTAVIQQMPDEVLKDTSLKVFSGRKGIEPVEDTYSSEGS